MSLSKLPFDVIFLILTNCTNLQDLSSLCRSAPEFWKAFCREGCSKQILRSVAVNSLPIEAFVLFEAKRLLASIRLPDGLPPSETTFPMNLWVMSLHSFDHLAEYYKDLASNGHLGHQEVLKTDLIDMSMTHLQILYICGELAEPFVRRHPLYKTSIKQARVPLSAAEMSRIVRAFYRSEIYQTIRQIFPWSEPRRGPTRSATSFFMLLAPSELEELRCVRTLIQKRWRMIIQEFFDHTLAIRNMPMTTASCTFMALTEKCRSKRQELVEKFLEPLAQGEMDTIFDREIRHLMQIWKTGDIHRHPLYPYHPYAFFKPQEMNSPPNKAWLWVYSSPNRTTQYADFPGVESLRTWGFALWDEERLELWSKARPVDGLFVENAIKSACEVILFYDRKNHEYIAKDYQPFWNRFIQNNWLEMRWGVPNMMLDRESDAELQRETIEAPKVVDYEKESFKESDVDFQPFIRQMFR